MDTQPKTNGFLKSNLFIFLLGQGFAFICWLTVFAFGWGKYSERFSMLDKSVGELQAKTTRMDEQGTVFVQKQQDQEIKAIAELKEAVHTMQKDTAHFDVMEAEHLRLTKDVEELKNGKK